MIVTPAVALLAGGSATAAGTGGSSRQLVKTLVFSIQRSEIRPLFNPAAANIMEEILLGIGVMKSKFAWWKLIAGYLLFVLFHQIYDLMGGGTLAAILGEGIESIYAHMKMYFYAYLIVSGIDYFLRRKDLKPAFWYSRMLIAASFPWMSIAIWFIPEALGLNLGSFELVYSLVITLVGLLFFFFFYDTLENIEFRPIAKTFLWIAFAAALITYVGFSFHVPDNFFIAS